VKKWKSDVTVIILSKVPIMCTEFAKERYNGGGVFRYLPMWDLDELLTARPYIAVNQNDDDDEKITDDQIKDRFRQVGGIPRKIFTTESQFSASLEAQDDAIRALTVRQAIQIAQGELSAIGVIGAGNPKSALIGYAKNLASDGTALFSARRIRVVSNLVERKISMKFQKELWASMLDSGTDSWKIVETICADLMVGPVRTFQSRTCCGNKKNRETYNNLTQIPLGGCKGIHHVQNITQAAMDENPGVLFQSVDPRYPLLISSIGIKTERFTRCSAQQESAALEKMLVGKPLKLYYLVPAERFGNFLTDPVEPETTSNLTSIFHVLIPNPNKEQVSPDEEESDDESAS